MNTFAISLKGAAIANHIRVTDLVKDRSTGRITGAKMKDELTGEEWTTKAKCVVNATGPFTGSNISKTQYIDIRHSDVTLA